MRRFGSCSHDRDFGRPRAVRHSRRRSVALRSVVVPRTDEATTGRSLPSAVRTSDPEDQMFTNVLVGVDGRQGGRDAIALAPPAGLGRRNDHPRQYLRVRLAAASRHRGHGGTPARRVERMLVAQRAAAGIDAQIVSPGIPPLVEDCTSSQKPWIGPDRGRILTAALLGRALIGDDTGSRSTARLVRSRSRLMVTGTSKTSLRRSASATTGRRKSGRVGRGS